MGRDLQFAAVVLVAIAIFVIFVHPAALLKAAPEIKKSPRLAPTLIVFLAALLTAAMATAQRTVRLFLTGEDDSPGPERLALICTFLC